MISSLIRGGVCVGAVLTVAFSTIAAAKADSGSYRFQNNYWSFGNSGVSCDELNTRWASTYHADLKASWPLASFECGNDSADEGIARAMYDLETTTFVPDSRGKVPHFYRWVMGLIQRTDFQELDKKRPWAIAQASQDGVVTLFKKFATTDSDWRAASLVHEARHIQPSDPSHVNCDAGEGKGEMRCDDRLRDDGTWMYGSGYNYTFQYLYWLRDSAAQTELDSAVAGALMKSMLTSNFNNVTPEQLAKWAY